MRVIFMGTPDYATEILKGILGDDDFEVVLLVTQKDKPVGRKRILTPPDIKRWILENGVDIEIYQPDSLKSDEVYKKISSLSPDVIVVAAYGKILPKEILKIAPCINLHASLLPRYRGASPIQSAILDGADFSGVTAMMMDEGLDSGDILAFRYVDMKDKRFDESFYDISVAARVLSLNVLKNLDSLNPIPQLDFEASRCVKVEKSDGLIDKEDEASDIYRKYLAYTPWPGIFLENGLKLKKVELSERNSFNEEPFVIEEITKRYVTVTCKRGSLKLLRVQAPSKKEMDAVAYVRGKRFEIGDKLV